MIKKNLEIIVKAADNKRASDIVALDTENVSVMADYFVIMDASSERQVKAIADNIVEKLNENQVEINQIEGKNEANWILIDAGDIIIHVFKKEQRDFYNLEKLWSNAPLVNLNEWIEED